MPPLLWTLRNLLYGRTLKVNQFFEIGGKSMSEKDITFHYTNEQMVKDLISLLPIKETDTVLDAGSGKNKVWFNNLHVKEKYECEIDDGCDFMEWNKKVDWVVGNPPFHLG